MLLKEILNINFKYIDKIAINNNFWNPTDILRLSNFILHLFYEYEKDGNVFTENDFTYFYKEYLKQLNFKLDENF